MTFKIFIHCLKCKDFRKCPIKFCPTEEIIYLECSSKNGILSLSNPCQCINTMQKPQKS